MNMFEGTIKMKRLALTIPLLAFCVVSGLMACPNCAADLASGNPNLADGMSYSIIGMASMPFLLFGSVAFFVIRQYKKKTNVQDFYKNN